MQHLAVVTSLVAFFRTFGGITALTLMSSVVNNKIASSIPAGETASSLDSLTSIDALPPAVKKQVQDLFANAIRWAYIALIPFAGISAISTLFLREVKITKDPDEEAQREQERNKEDAELGNVPPESQGATQGAERPTQAGGQQRTTRKRTRVYGPLTGIIWCIQALGDKLGWRK